MPGVMCFSTTRWKFSVVALRFIFCWTKSCIMAMMQDFVQQNMNRNATTENFQRVVEKHMTPGMKVTADGKMDWFFGEWVYGTTLPKYKFDYTLTAQDDGKVQLKGTITQSEVPDGFIMIVPIYMDFDGTVTRLGSAKMTGNKTVN